MSENGTLKLGRALEFQDAIALLRFQDDLKVERDLKGSSSTYLVIGPSGMVVGKLGARSWPAVALSAGKEVLSCNVNSVRQKDWGIAVHARFVIRDSGEEIEARPVRSAPTYPVNLVGESFYQEAIAECFEGEPVRLEHDPNNPYDDRAVAAYSSRVDVIGYLARDGWLTRAIVDDGAAVSATIAFIHRASSRHRHDAVILAVKLG